MAEYESVDLSLQKTTSLGNPYPQNCSCKDSRASIRLPKPSSDTIIPTKGDVKYSCIYLATSAGEVCAFSVLLHMNHLGFFSDRKELFCFNWVASAEIPHHRGNQFEIPLPGRRSDKVRKKKNAIVQETSHHGLRGSTRLGLFQACLDATFWRQIRCLHVAAWEDRFPWPNCFRLKLFDSLWPSSPTKLKWHIQLYLAFELGGKWLFCSARGLF